MWTHYVCIFHNIDVNLLATKTSLKFQHFCILFLPTPFYYLTSKWFLHSFASNIFLYRLLVKKPYMTTDILLDIYVIYLFRNFIYSLILYFAFVLRCKYSTFLMSYHWWIIISKKSSDLSFQLFSFKFLFPLKSYFLYDKEKFF